MAGSLTGMILLVAGMLGIAWIDARRMASWDADLRAAHLSAGRRQSLKPICAR